MMSKLVFGSAGFTPDARSSSLNRASTPRVLALSGSQSAALTTATGSLDIRTPDLIDTSLNSLKALATCWSLTSRAQLMTPYRRTPCSQAVMTCFMCKFHDPLSLIWYGRSILSVGTGSVRAATSCISGLQVMPKALRYGSLPNLRCSLTTFSIVA